MGEGRVAGRFLVRGRRLVVYVVVVHDDVMCCGAKGVVLVDKRDLGSCW